MRKFSLKLAFIAVVVLTASAVSATTFTFTSNDGSNSPTDMTDLEHGYYYGWSIANQTATNLGTELTAGYTIKSATLTYKSIYNYKLERDDQLNTFLLSAPPSIPSKQQTVPVVINGVAQGKTVYTYEKTTTNTKVTSYIKTEPEKYNLPSGYTLTDTKTKINKGVTTYQYTSTKATVTTKTGTSPALSGYTTVGSTFVQDTVNLAAGIKLSSDLWKRLDGESRMDIDWGVESFRIQDIDGDPLNPWHDDKAKAPGRDLVYNLDVTSLIKLLEYAQDGSFGFGIDPDCHYYNSGITFVVETEQAPVPEPSTFALLGFGLLGAGFMRRRMKK